MALDRFRHAGPPLRRCRMAALILLALLSACAGQRPELQPPSPAMFAAVDRLAWPVDRGQGGALAIGVPGSSVFRLSMGVGPALSAERAARCNTTVASLLEALGFRPEQLRLVQYDIQGASGRQSSDVALRGWNAWVTFTDRPGRLVAVLRADCSLGSFHTRGGLTLPERG